MAFTSGALELTLRRLDPDGHQEVAMGAYQPDPNVVPLRVQSLPSPTARRGAADRQRTKPVLYSDFFLEPPTVGVER